MLIACTYPDIMCRLNNASPCLILALAFCTRPLLGHHWFSIGNCDIGFISARNNDIILVQHIGNLTDGCLKIAGEKKTKTKDIQYIKFTK